jgi:pimeloyl-ACP methyl ester carboxylesterase
MRYGFVRGRTFQSRSSRPTVTEWGVVAEVAMREAWELLTSGPEDADRSVLLLPGGANAARSFDLVMADHALAGVRLVATTLPGMAGAPLTDDVSIPTLARTAGELAKEHRCDAVVGFSHGATVALETLLSGHFQGPVVLLGISLTTEDEAGFFRAAVRVSQKVGSWPMAILLRLMPLMARSAKTPGPHKRDLIEDLKQNKAADSVRVSGTYLDYIAADRDYAAQLAASGSPVWLVHAEKGGDGGLTDSERATLEAAANVHLVTVPGKVFLLPDEAPTQTAAVIADALAKVT